MLAICGHIFAFKLLEMFLSCRDRPLQILLLLSQIRGAASHGAFHVDLLATHEFLTLCHRDWRYVILTYRAEFDKAQPSWSAVL